MHLHELLKMGFELTPQDNFFLQNVKQNIIYTVAVTECTSYLTTCSTQ